MKYAIFRRDARAQLLVDDSTGFRAALVRYTVEIREDLAAELPRSCVIRGKHGVAVQAMPYRRCRTGDDEHLRAVTEEGRVRLAITPGRPPSSWT